MAYKVTDDFSSDIGANGAPSLKLSANSEVVSLPDSSYVRDADLSRDGMDLVLEGPQGTIVIEGYFSAMPAPQLIAPDGIRLTPDLVDSFTGGGNQYADAGSMSDASPVGSVSETSGGATVTRVDGTIETVTIGTPIYQGDVVETAGSGAVNIVFIDETEFAVSDDARLAIDEYVYDPATESGSQNFSVLKGVFVFTSGMIGRDDPDDVQIDTPAGSIGIRGTIIAGDVTAGEITVVEGAIVLTDFGGNQMTLASQFETARFSPGGGVENIGQLSANDVAGKFASVSGVAANLFSSINDTAASESQNSASGNSEASGNDSASEGEAGADNAQSGNNEAQGEATGDGEAAASEGAEANSEGENASEGNNAEGQSESKSSPAGEAKGNSSTSSNESNTNGGDATSANGEGAAANGPNTAGPANGVGPSAGKGPGPIATTLGTGDSKGGFGSGHGPATGGHSNTQSTIGDSRGTTTQTNNNNTRGTTNNNTNVNDGTTSTASTVTDNTTNTDSSDNTNDETTTPPFSAQFVASYSFDEIAHDASPTGQTVLAKIVVNDSSITESDFTFSNIHGTFDNASGDIRVIKNGANQFDVVVDNSDTDVREALDYDLRHELNLATKDLKVSVNGVDLDLATEIRQNISDIDENPYFKPTFTDYDASGILGDDSGDNIDGVSLHHFHGSNNTDWTFDFKTVFKDDDLKGPNGALVDGTTETLKFFLTVDAVNTLYDLGANIEDVRDSSGSLTLTYGSELEFDGLLKIHFGTGIAAPNNFNLEVKAEDYSGDTSSQSFYFSLADDNSYINTNITVVTDHYLSSGSSGGDTIVFEPSVSIGLTNNYIIDRNNNEIFFGNNDDGNANGGIVLGTSSPTTGNIVHLGEGLNQILINDQAEQNTVIGGGQKDIIQVKEAKNKVFGMGGDDEFFFHESGPSTILSELQSGTVTDTVYDGGEDNQDFSNGHKGDTAKFATFGGSSSLDFTNISGLIKNVETINLINGQDDDITLLSRQDVIDMTDSRNRLIIDLDNGTYNDTLFFDSESNTFTQGEDISIEGDTYNSFSDGEVTLLITAASNASIDGSGDIAVA